MSSGHDAPDDHGPLAATVARLGDGRPVEVLGRGMEGTVVALDDDRVAKVWHAGATPPSPALRAVLDHLGAAGLPVATPRVLDLLEVGGRTVTVERRLAGATMAEALAAGTLDRTTALARFVEVVGTLGTVAPVAAARGLAVLGETTSLYAGDEDFPAALGALVTRQVARHHTVLAAALPDLDPLVSTLVRRLTEVDSGRRNVVHGDLFPGNVLVDATGRPTAVLDLGFLTTVGDPAFEAAVAAGLFDMYGPAALATELDLLARAHHHLGHDPTALRVYRAAYSVVTATVYDPTGTDGHFAWCVAGLRRPDVRAAILG